MARTVQSISPVLVETAKTQYAISSSSAFHAEEPEDNISLMISLCDSANNLCILLEKLYHVIKMKNLEIRIRAKYKKEEGK